MLLPAPLAPTTPMNALRAMRRFTRSSSVRPSRAIVTSMSSMALAKGAAGRASGWSVSASGCARNSSMRRSPARAGSTSREYWLAYSSDVLTDSDSP